MLTREAEKSSAENYDWKEKVKKMMKNENTSSWPGAGLIQAEIVYKVVTAWWGL